MESLAESETALDTIEVSKGSIFFNMLAMTENPRLSFEFHIEKTVGSWVWVILFYLIVDGDWVWVILFYLIVDGDWVWVILGLCWVWSSTDKTVAGGWWLGAGDFGFVLGLWEGSREEREGNNKKCKKNEYFIE